MTDTDKLTQAGIQVDRIECGYMILRYNNTPYIVLTRYGCYELIGRDKVKACRTVEEVINLIKNANVNHCKD